MKSKSVWLAVSIIAALAVAGVYTVSAQGQDDDSPAIHLRGVVNDFPVSSNPSAGPWELRGPWSLELQPSSGTANFSASLTMEFSDLAAGSGAATDARHQHAHQITLREGTLIQNPPQSDCPSGITPFPTYTWLIEVTGMAEVTANGGLAFGGPVPLQVCVGGGPNSRFSNITLVFTKLASGAPSPATNHFGAQAIHGVVRLSH